VLSGVVAAAVGDLVVVAVVLIVVASAEVCSFRDHRHCPVAVDDVRNFLL
jgi:hypothetical protein